jgi:hypothetical protein
VSILPESIQYITAAGLGSTGDLNRSVRDQSVVYWS